MGAPGAQSVPCRRHFQVTIIDVLMLCGSAVFSSSVKSCRCLGENEPGAKENDREIFGYPAAQQCYRNLT